MLGRVLEYAINSLCVFLGVHSYRKVYALHISAKLAREPQTGLPLAAGFVDLRKRPHFCGILNHFKAVFSFLRTENAPHPVKASETESQVGEITYLLSGKLNFRKFPSLSRSFSIPAVCS